MPLAGATVQQFLHGQSNPTYVVDAGDAGKLVLRKQPAGELLPGAHRIDREHRVMSCLASSKCPVPKTRYMCEDPSIIGTPFFVYDYVNGSFFADPALGTITEPSQRACVYRAMARDMAALHSVDPADVGLADFGTLSDYAARQIHVWGKQYAASATRRIRSMEQLQDELLATPVPDVGEATRGFINHGDLRLDNMIIAPGETPDETSVAAILDWELATLGDTPLLDVAYNMMPYYMPPQRGCSITGFQGLELGTTSSSGIPTPEQYLHMYTEAQQEFGQQSVVDPRATQDFYLAVAFFKAAAILQGVYKRGIEGNASAPETSSFSAVAETLAHTGLSCIWRHQSDHDAPQAAVVPLHAESHTSGNTMIELGRSMVPSGFHSLVSDRAFETTGRVREFVQSHVLPIESEVLQHQYSSRDRWTKHHPALEDLKVRAKSEGLWNLFLPVDSDPDARFGAGFTNLEYATMAEATGASLLAPEVFNCNAPDTGNMETLVRYATPEQQEQWLKPLLAGEIRSCFAMTEPAVASSDATNMQATITDTGDGYLLVNGHKWWTSGALDPKCAISIFMGVHVGSGVDPDSRHQRHSMVLVPMDAPGVTVARPLTTFGFDDAPHGHAETIFENVRVPASNVLLGPGRGFEIAQGRLGPGRIHHCMRLIGASERALDLMCERVQSRHAFGKPIAAQGTIIADVASAEIDIQQTRLLCLQAAHMMDTVGNKTAKAHIAMIKIAAPKMAKRVIDNAMQAHGAVGLSSDLPLSHLWTWARILQLADGPDEVHIASLGKSEIRRRNA